jgi:hypothetical protein
VGVGAGPARLTEAHSPDPEFAGRRFARGEVVEVERDDPDWPDWLLCNLADGTQAWLPKEDLAVAGDSATLTNDYDSTELEIGAGEQVTVERVYGTWALCSAAGGRTGWVPERKLDR